MCWTASLEASPKWRSSALATCPCSSPKASSTFASSRSATLRARSTNARVELARGPLELRLDEVGVGAGLLAVEHPRADLDRVGDELRGGLAGLLALPGEPDGAGVLDDEPVDEQRLARGADMGGTAEGRGGEASMA